MCSDQEIISKEFLETALGKTVKSFTVKAHADTGDNYMSVIYTLEVHLKSKCNIGGKEYLPEEPLHLFTKCYPSNPGRQLFLNNLNVFWKEISFYKLWIPELIKFQQDLGLQEIIKPNFPAFVGGSAVNFDDKKDEPNKSEEVKLYKSWENFVMMVDLKKMEGFKLADRHLGLDRDHAVLIVDALAKIHAMSWAYKQAKNIQEIVHQFPSLQLRIDTEQDRNMIEQMILSNVDVASATVKSTLGEDSPLIESLKSFKQIAVTVGFIGYHSSLDGEIDVDLAKYFRERPDAVTRPHKESLWRIVSHGDSHLTNMMFRYNSRTHKPEEVILVDMQLCREACPTADLAYLIYTSSGLEFRKNHLNEILNIYFEKFNHYCRLLKCETLPGFTLEEVKFRFHRMKPYALVLGLITAGIYLKEKEDAVQLDALEGWTQEEMLVSLSKGMDKNARYNKRVTELLQEMKDDGVI